MTDNNFDLAAALLSDAADLIGHAPKGTHTVDIHAYGALQLVASTDSTRRIVLWTADNDRVLAAVEATTDPDAEQPTTRIIAFRAAGLMFAGRADHTFAAHGRHTYVLAANVGADTWQVTIDADTTTLTDTDLDTALSLIERFELAAYAAG
ncbi:hypothetical protein Mycch_5475 (plasmid) [Mycolicibacterium chubuense NBB4]|uniref:Uncharacterized protein n=1 Tax=Mycolicibacterium chubuense (strain NBB4) TaxID=710421 RepID=I4BS86_MYCCN|nr:hypothetical protein [Mycolicibacterium chubuense]AFM20143.1 hypothetical protein Mycch_5475 [Mycolicibacterium chubuense NBB4]